MNLEELAARNKRRETRSPAIITGVRASLPRELPPPLVNENWAKNSYSDTIRIINQYKAPTK